MIPHTLLKDVPTDKLEEELRRRNAQKKEDEKPKELPVKNWVSVIKLCQGYLDNTAKGRVDENLRQCIYEAAMEAVFGDEVWEYINGWI